MVQSLGFGETGVRDLGVDGITGDLTVTWV